VLQILLEELWNRRSHVMLIPHLHWYHYQKLLYKVFKNLCVQPGCIKHTSRPVNKH